jgi:hypothetical protein
LTLLGSSSRAIAYAKRASGWPNHPREESFDLNADINPPPLSLEDELSRNISLLKQHGQAIERMKFLESELAALNAAFARVRQRNRHSADYSSSGRHACRRWWPTASSIAVFFDPGATTDASRLKCCGFGFYRR